MQNQYSLTLLRGVALALFLTISGCTDLKLATVNLIASGAPVDVQTNLAYGELPMQKADLYRPDVQTDSSLPLVVFFHGGAWREGSKEQYKFVGTTLAERGFIVLVADYRKFPQIVFPAFVEDAAHATAWAITQAESWGADADAVFLLGHSSGAHMAALVATRQNYLQAHGASPGQLAGLIGMSGPYAFTPSEPQYVEVFGDLQDYRQMQADHFIDTAVPSLLIYGDQDQVVAPQNHQAFASALEQVAARVQINRYPELDHSGTVAEFAAPLAQNSRLVQDVQNFIDSLAR